ncbi:MAG TPA: HAD family hydrolase [Ignavibacteriaceae bacterium]
MNRQSRKSDIFFDLDGTLLESKSRVFQLFTDLTSQHTINFDEYWKLKKSGLDNNRILLNNLSFSEDAIKDFWVKWFEKIESEAYLNFDVVFPNSIEVLLELKESGFAMHIVTARKNQVNTLRQIERSFPADLFSSIHVTKTSGAKREAILSIKSNPNSFDVMVGDTDYDIQTGRSLGIKTIAVLSGFRSEEILKSAKPDVIIAGIAEMKPALKELGWLI